MRLRKITAGLAAVLALLGAIVGVPLLLVAIGAAPTSVPSLAQLHRELFTQDQNMAVVVAVLAGVVWFCWAAFTLSTAREIAVAIATRGRRSAAPLRRLEWVGRPAAQLVAAVVLVFVAAPGLISATSPAAAATPVTATATVAPPTGVSTVKDASYSTVVQTAAAQTALTSSVATAPTAAGRSAPGAGPTGAQTASATYTVRRRDTLWSIAGAKLGNPLRWPELARLNPEVVGPAPDFLILAGSSLALGPPAERSGGDQHVVAVKAGDTLSGIATRAGAPDWHSIWAANQDRAEPGRAALSDPNHIEPGWSVAMPAVSSLRAPSDAGSHATVQAPSPAPARTPTAAQPRVVAPSRSRTPDTSRQGATSASGVEGHILERPLLRRVVPRAGARGPVPDGRLTPSTPSTPDIKHTPAETGPAIGAFAAGGALLAGGAMGALLVARRRQSRNRRPGRTLAATEPELIPVEKAVVTAGGPGLATARFLDAALRSLCEATAADPNGQLPDVIAVRHGLGQLNLRLSASHRGPVPAPWTADDSGLWWSISLEQELPTEGRAGSHLAPLPTLAAIGSDEQGYCWLLDLEHAGAIALTGDPDRCMDLARFLAAELSVNTWSDHVSVTMVGFGRELVGMNPARLHHSSDLEATAVARSVDAVDAVDACAQAGVDVRTGRVRDICADTFMPHVLLVDPSLPGGVQNLADVLKLAATHRGHCALAVILAAGGDLSNRARVTMQLTAAGRLLVPELGLDLIANQLPSHEGLGLSQMLSQAAAAGDEPMPAAAGDQPWQAYCDAAGSLLAEHTLPRPAQGQSSPLTADELATSLLPLPDEGYLHAAATTAEDLATLAPRVPSAVLSGVREADPSLDQDVACWLDSDCDLPRLTLMGPVQLRARGVLEKNRVGFFTEVIAYLATREHGATAVQFETALGLAPARARSDIRIARSWLGINPRTGRKHLPDALKSASGQARGIGVYELEDVLVDADLFRRLRVRGQARGSDDGIADLAMALSLVSGTPFDQLRAAGYEWLTEGVRLDQHLLCATVDVAHLVTTHALATGDLVAARAAAELAQLAAPYEEIPRLDLVAVRAAEGHLEQSVADLREQVCNRSDDGGPPEDLSHRTQAILRQRQWLSRAG